MSPKRILALRKRLGLSQREFAKRLRISQPTAQRIETGGHIAGSVEVLLKQLEAETKTAKL